jgi:hypothetical protein
LRPLSNEYALRGFPTAASIALNLALQSARMAWISSIISLGKGALPSP